MGTLPWLKQNRLSPLAPTEDDERFLPSAASLAQQNFDARRAGANPGFAEAEELHAQDVAKQTGRNPLKEKQATGANQQAFLDYLARISGEADSAMNTERERQSMAMAGAQAEDMKQAGINNIMASVMMGARNAPAQQSFMQAAQANPNQKAVAEQGKGFGEWLAKRYDIGKNAGEYNQAAYHDLMAEQTKANLEQRGEIAKKEGEQFALTLEQRKAEALQQAKEKAKERALDWARLSSEEKNRALQRELTLGSKAQKANDDNVEDMSKRFQKTASGSSIADLKAAIDKGGDLPGYGTAAGFLPDVAVSADGNKLRSAAEDLVDMRLRARTGAGAQAPEMVRILRTYGIFPGASDDQARAGLKKLYGDTEQEIRQIQAGYSPAVVEEFRKRGGVTADDIFGVKAPPKGAWPVILRNPETGAEAEAWDEDGVKAANAKKYTEVVK